MKRRSSIFRRAAELTPDDPIIMEHLGDAYAKLNDLDNAVKYYRIPLKKAIQILMPLKGKSRLCWQESQ